MTMFYQDAITQILLGDVREELALLPDRYVQTCVTSPPYWGLRDYGTASWEGGDSVCDHTQKGTKTGTKTTLRNDGRNHSGPYDDERALTVGFPYRQHCKKCGAVRIDAQLGLEATPDEYVANMVQVFREVRRVLKDDGTLWLNLGDSYCGSRVNDGTANPGISNDKKRAAINGSTRPNSKIENLKPKDLVGIPWRVAFALQADGWYLRSDIIWHKPNPMPESVTDRPTKAHEYLFLLTKSERYYYDADAIKEQGVSGALNDKMSVGLTGGAYSPPGQSAHANARHDKQRSKRDSFKRDNSKRAAVIPGQTVGTHRLDRDESEWDVGTRNKRSVWTIATQPYTEAHFATFPPKLIEPCVLAGSRSGDIVLDPFHGAGTTAMVSKQLGRKYVGIDLNQTYIEMSLKRIQQEVLDLR